jgi:hypothetical protein
MKIQKRTHLICTIIYKLSHSLTHSCSLSIYKSAIADDLQFNFHSGSTHEVIFLLHLTNYCIFSRHDFAAKPQSFYMIRPFCIQVALPYRAARPGPE